MSARTRYRYLIFSIEGELPGRDRLEADILEGLTELFGVFGLSDVEPRLVIYEGGRGVVRVNREGLVKFRAFVALQRGPYRIRVVKVTGTLRKARAVLESLPGPH